MKLLASLCLPSQPEAQNDPLHLVATARQRHTIRYADKRLAGLKRKKPLTARQHLNWLLGRLGAVPGMTTSATRLLELIARLAKDGRAVNTSLAYLAHCLTRSRQRISKVFKVLTRAGLVMRVGRLICLRFDVLEAAEVQAREDQPDLNRKANVNGPLRIHESDSLRERAEPKPSTRYSADDQQAAWRDLMTCDRGSMAFERAVTTLTRAMSGTTRASLLSMLPEPF